MIVLLLSCVIVLLYLLRACMQDSVVLLGYCRAAWKRVQSRNLQTGR